MDFVQGNADRFMGFADVYDSARPSCPGKAIELILRYLGRDPALVVDLGCGTGLSSMAWRGIGKTIIGIDPSPDMLKMARQKSTGCPEMRFEKGFADATGLEDACADVVTCSQSFHWMNPDTTLPEVARILKEGGVFATYDCDWPPVCHWEVEQAYLRLFEVVKTLETVRPEIRDTFRSWPKDKHLHNIQQSGAFRFVREIVFSVSESCDAEHFIAIALSQGGLQAVRKAGIQEIEPLVDAFAHTVRTVLGKERRTMELCYRMRVGVR